MAFFIHTLLFFIESFVIWTLTMTAFRRRWKIYWKKIVFVSIVISLIHYLFSEILSMNYLWLVLYSIPFYPIVHRLYVVKDTWSIAWCEGLVGYAGFRIVQLNVFALANQLDLTTYTTMEHNLIHLAVFRALIPSLLVYFIQIWMQKNNMGYQLISNKKIKRRFWIIFIILYALAIGASQDVWKDVIINDAFTYFGYWHGFTGLIFFFGVGLYIVWKTNRTAWKLFYLNKIPKDFEKINRLKEKRKHS